LTAELNVRHICQISFYLDPQRTPAQILTDWWPLVDVAEMVVAAGARVSVIQACCQQDTVARNGVNYHFVAPESGVAGMARGHAFAKLIQQLDPDVLHVHGLGFPEDVCDLAKLLPNTPIFLQDHANGVPRLWRRRTARRGLALASGISFCAMDQARPFLNAGLIDRKTEVLEIPECSSRFMPGDKAMARAATGVYGDPAVLWVGHLDENKDPLTVLRGIAEAVRRSKDIQLWCCFGQAPLKSQVDAQITSDTRLAGRVHLLGKVPHRQVEQLMCAADIFVLGSHHEGSGCSLIEALACGLAPVVSDIPSFRALTAGGSIGALWPPEDSARLCEAVVVVAACPRGELSASVRRHFESELSFDAVGRKLMGAYEGALLRRDQDGFEPASTHAAKAKVTRR
jgi:glycosyltransferase involved in cell wall biosynthesis